MTNLNSILRGSLSAAAAGAFFLGAIVPANAAERNEKSGEAISASAAAATAPEKKICLSPTVSGGSSVTGSLISKTQCKTKAQWEARGVRFQPK